MLNELLGQSFALVPIVAIPVSMVLILVLANDFWMARIITNYLGTLNWILLEIKIPRENIKSTTSMEQVFATVYGIYSFGLRLPEIYWEGKVEHWLSFEMTGSSDGVHFYIKTPKKNRNIVETAFFSQYPNIEIHEVEDYVKKMPRNLPNKEYDIFASDIILGREDAYPIKTYYDFEDETDDEDKNVDPLAVAAEILSNLKPGETVWLQWLVRPAGNEWVKKSQDVTDELAGRKPPKEKKKILAGSGEFAQNLLRAPATHPEWAGVSEDGSQLSTFRFYTPGEQETLKAIARKASKRAYDTILRFVYIDKRDEFTGENVESVIGIIQQFATLDMNFFKPNKKTFTKKSTVSKIPISAYREWKLEKLKKSIYQAYLNREIPQPRLSSHFRLKMKTSILNIEELASVYHPPTIAVKAPKLRPLGFKKGEPPIDLPTKQ